jgi:hypothetical protein
MALRAEVSGTAIWGHGPTRYAVYKIDIFYKEELYTIYRRFREFENLHTTVSDLC